ncbi:hypothetical protein NFI95_15835 [Acetobacteraceae bacterium KSS8]|uniref:Uncharacterized protein n=1 Tax=Endosaccharibacter trunci TaxID=2812733 RepID=A0ABT1WAI8_9PROT|nr:hypothetical protein [Acetobacteraceae bacterium KSS8]
MIAPVTVDTFGFNIPVAAMLGLGNAGIACRLDSDETTITRDAARTVARFIGVRDAELNPVLHQALGPAIEILHVRAPAVFPEGLSGVRNLYLLGAQGTAWFIEQTYNFRGTPSSLIRLREGLQDLQAILASAATSKHLPDVVASSKLLKVNRYLGEIAPLVRLCFSEAQSLSVATPANP